MKQCNNPLHKKQNYLKNFFTVYYYNISVYIGSKKMPIDFKTAINIAKRNPIHYKVMRVYGGNTHIIRNMENHKKVYNFDKKHNLVNIIHTYKEGNLIQNHYSNGKYTSTWFYTDRGIRKVFKSFKEFRNFFTKEWSQSK